MLNYVFFLVKSGEFLEMLNVNQVFIQNDVKGFLAVGKDFDPPVLKHDVLFKKLRINYCKLVADEME